MKTRVIRAAAGCGKTTALAIAYLDLVRAGVSVDRIIAITFTRLAAAELVERVGTALRAAAGDPEAVLALGSSAPRYLQAAPQDPLEARAALADLGSAPIGTTDHFVNQMLAEFALYAELALPDGRLLPLDIGLMASTSLAPHLDAAARRLVNPPEGPPPADVALLTPSFTLEQIRKLICHTDEGASRPPILCADLLVELSRRTLAALEDHDLPTELELHGLDESALFDRLQTLTKVEGRWTLPSMVRWFARGADAQECPPAFVSWIRCLARRSGAAKNIWRSLSKRSIDFGIAHVRLSAVLDTLRQPYEDPRHLALADELRQAVHRLRVQVRSEALETAAIQGELPHEELTRAAARLAKNPITAGRFGALLVDEVQDANPDQLALYEALGGQPEMLSVFVGDGRQSIYLFRGGEPAGLERLTQQAGHAGQVEHLLTNYRSTPDLVDAQRALFAALDAPMRALGQVPLEPLQGLQADPRKASEVLSPAHHEHAAPVLIVKTAGHFDKPVTHAVLDAFHDRVTRARTEPGHGNDTAAVLCPTWKLAHEAAQRLQQVSGDERAAWVEGGESWRREGVGRDVAFLLRALADTSDDVAWLAVLKHPSIGLTDGALARIVDGIGVRGVDHPIPLGALLTRDGLEHPHLPSDIRAWELARPALLDARARLGRDDTAEVIERVLIALDWRTVLGAGPDGDDDLARLEVLLDWIGDSDASGLGVDAIQNMLAAEEGDSPRVRLTRSATTITCTTVFQAKGLAWDHVCVLKPGRAGRLQADEEAETWVDLGEGERRLVGLTFDPTGGMLPFDDPLRRVAQVIQAARFDEEGARLAYVAVTRARRSVTLGMTSVGRKKKDPAYTAAAEQLIQDAWRHLDHPQIAAVSVPDPPTLTGVTLHTTVRRGALLPAPCEPRGRVELAPSAAAAGYSRVDRAIAAKHLADHVTLSGGFRPGDHDRPPPREARPDFRASEWGTLAHGWFAYWGFRRDPTDALIRDFLLAEWGADVPEVRQWLLTVSLHMASADLPLWRLLTDARSRLLFELPLIGIGGADDDVILSGRIDLLVKRPEGVVIVDFKAGDHSPTSTMDLIQQANLDRYGPQLESYRGALERMGYPVSHVALWFVRTGAVVTW